jgi:hypothetical protein
MKNCKNCRLYKRVKAVEDGWNIYYCYPESKGIKNVENHSCRKYQGEDLPDIFKDLFAKK